MNYKRIYYSIIEKYKDQPGITEKHHIIPKSIGGSDDPKNLVRVSPRVHYILHLLLYKFSEGDDKRKMYFAIWNMSHQGKTKTGAMYQFIREECRDRHLLMVNRIPWNKGKKHSPETIQKLKNTRKGKCYGKVWRILYKGVEYNSIRECIKITGDSYYKITTYGKKLEKYRPQRNLQSHISSVKHARTLIS